MRCALPLLISLIVGLSTQALAWNDTGHRLSVFVAWTRLEQNTKTELIEILRHHPRFAQDFLNNRPVILAQDKDGTNRWLLSQAAVWPDIARGYSSDLKTRFNRPRWHYINYPLFLSQEERQALEESISTNLEREAPSTLTDDLNIVQAFKGNLEVLKDNQASAPDRAVALCWVLHLAGDVHQPLHAASLFTIRLFPVGDRRGNRIPIGNRGSANNLHKFWDRLLGNAQSLALLNRSAELILQRSGSDAEQGASAMDIGEWVDESYSLANRWVYDDVIRAAVVDSEDDHQGLSPIDLEETYDERGRRIATRQIAKAGHRIAEILNGSF